MGVITNTIEVIDLHNYIPEYNKNGTEKHIICDGARFHVTYWDTNGSHCSIKNCEVNNES